MSLDNGRGNVQNIPFVGGLKHNLLSVRICVSKGMMLHFVLKVVR